MYTWLNCVYRSPTFTLCVCARKCSVLFFASNFNEINIGLTQFSQWDDLAFYWVYRWIAIDCHLKLIIIIIISDWKWTKIICSSGFIYCDLLFLFRFFHVNFCLDVNWTLIGRRMLWLLYVKTIKKKSRRKWKLHQFCFRLIFRMLSLSHQILNRLAIEFIAMWEFPTLCTMWCACMLVHVRAHFGRKGNRDRENFLLFSYFLRKLNIFWTLCFSIHRMVI